MQQPGGLGATGPLPTHPKGDWERAQTHSGRPGQGWRVQAFIIPMPPREDPTERTDQNPSFFFRKKEEDLETMER